MKDVVLFIAGAEPLRLPATPRLYVVKPVGAAVNVQSDGPMSLLIVDEMTVGCVVDRLEAEGLAGQVARVVCVDEQYILVAAKIREALGVVGQSFMSARAFRNKFFMKEFLKTAEHFTLPRYWSPIQRKDVAAVFGDASGGRIVRKPILGSGGMEVAIAENLQAIGEVAQDEMLESFVDLPMLHVDGLIVGGEVRFFVVSKYINFCLSFTDFKYVGSEFSHDARLNARAERAMREIFQLLPSFQDGAFHLEMFYSDTEMVFCEIASRPGGIGIVRALEEAYGINLYRAAFLAQCGRPVELPSMRRAETSWLLVPHGVSLDIDAGRLGSLPWLVEFFVAEEGRERSLHCADGKFKAVLKGDSLSEVVERRCELLASIGYA